MAFRKQKQRLELGEAELVRHGKGSAMTLRSISRRDYDRIAQAMNAGTRGTITVIAFSIRLGFFGTRVVGRRMTVAPRAYSQLGAFEPHGTYTVRLPKDN